MKISKWERQLENARNIEMLKEMWTNLRDGCMSVNASKTLRHSQTMSNEDRKDPRNEK